VELSGEGLSRFLSLISPFLDEREWRLLAASMVEVLGWGGQARVAEATGASRNTLIDGAEDLAAGPVAGGRVRRAGAGPKRKIDLDRELLVALDCLVEPESRGDPMCPLRWTLKSTRALAGELTRLGHKVGANLVGELLGYLGYSLQANAKVTEGAQHADRGGQFRYINDRAGEHLGSGQPVISIDCKKRQNVGDYANVDAEWEPKGSPTRVGVHDFPDPEMGKAIPYGVLDFAVSEGWVNVGDDHDTPAFAVGCIARWWERMGRARYPQATALLITADAGGSNSYRSRVFKTELAKLAATIRLVITVCHMPPGMSKWNKIEHRMFSFISINWPGKPLVTYRAVVELIAATTTKSGLRIEADLDTGSYPIGVKVTDKELAAIPIRKHKWHPDWNYSLLPHPPCPLT
jgi:hypothetical protein